MIGYPHQDFKTFKLNDREKLWQRIRRDPEIIFNKIIQTLKRKAHILSVLLVGILVIYGLRVWRTYKTKELRHLEVIGKNVHRMRELNDIQKTLIFLKPEKEWNYNNTWQFIGDPLYREQVYSAYFDPRTELYSVSDLDDDHIFYGSIRVFAVLPLHLWGKISCNIKYEETLTEQVRAYEAVAIHEHWDMEFSVYTIMCPLRSRRGGSIVHLPESVAIVNSANPLSHEVPTYVPISYSKEHVLAKPTKILALCIGPLQLNYNQVLRLVEFIEIYRLLGAEKFYFYLLDASPEIIATLEYYQRSDFVQVNHWNFHGYAFEHDVRYGGIIAEFNECIFRATFVDGYRYVAVVDLDEIIIPLKHNTLLDLMRVVEVDKTSAFVFSNVFFYSEKPNDTSSVPYNVRNRFLYTQVKTQRTMEPMMPHQRSKLIVKARTVIEMGNHEMWRSVKGTSQTYLHYKEALLFHYRTKCRNCRVSPLGVDFTARRFGSILWNQVEDVCEKVFKDGICPMGTEKKEVS